MPEALNAGIDLGQSVSDIQELEGDFEKLKAIIEQEVDEAVEEIAEEFKKEVIAQIEASDIDADPSGELLTSWQVKPDGLAKYTVRSTADHAVYLELGTKQHEITGNPRLIFEPEPGTFDEYPEGAQRDDGLISIHKVDHPGNEAYGYFADAYKARDWQEALDEKLIDAFDDAATQAGFEL